MNFVSEFSGFGLISNKFGEDFMMISRIFTAHPRSVGETYLEHMVFAGWFAGKLAAAAVAALIHALIPCCFEKSASSIIAELYQRTHNRSG